MQCHAGSFWQAWKIFLERPWKAPGRLMSNWPPIIRISPVTLYLTLITDVCWPVSTSEAPTISPHYAHHPALTFQYVGLPCGSPKRFGTAHHSSVVFYDPTQRKPGRISSAIILP